MTRQPDDIGRMAQNFAEMEKRERKRDAIAQLLFIFLFSFGALCSGFVFALILHIFRSL